MLSLIDSSACDINPCLNNGLCVANMKTVICRCLSEFIGTLCQFAIKGYITILIIVSHLRAFCFLLNFKTSIFYITNYVAVVFTENKGKKHNYPIMTENDKTSSIYLLMQIKLWISIISN